MKSVYLDHAAATPLDPRVLEVMRPYLSDRFYNPSALYLAARQVSESLENSRRTVARYLGCRPIEVVFTAGGTEANNLAVQGVLASFPGSKAVISAIEHDSVRKVAGRYPCGVIPVTAQGLVDPEGLAEAVDDSTVLVSIMYANNEIGTTQPVREIGRSIQTVRADRAARGVQLPLYLHTDAAQASNYLDLHVSKLGVDLMTLNGGKIYGPKQSGALYVRSGVKLSPLLYGGGQERGLRSGTENVAASIGFAEALSIAQDIRREEAARLIALQQYFMHKLKELPADITINGSLKKRLPNNVHVTIRGQDNERLIMALDEAGIMAAAGSACGAGKDEPSYVLRALGLDTAAARASLRFTMGRGTSQEYIDYTVDRLSRLLQA